MSVQKWHLKTLNKAEKKAGEPTPTRGGHADRKATGQIQVLTATPFYHCRLKVKLFDFFTSVNRTFTIKY